MDSNSDHVAGFVNPRQLSRPTSSNGGEPSNPALDNYIMTNHNSGSENGLPDADFASGLNDLGWDLPEVDQLDDKPLLDKFFLDRGACFAPQPCNYCRRHRLQCLIMQTGPANPNPETSCSTCVGLFRGCSLASGHKRQASLFETTGPVIGHLHGVSEEPDFNDDDRSSNSPAPFQDTTSTVPIVAYDRDKRPSSRRYQKTRILRGWFDTHSEHPYPTTQDVDFFILQTGLTKTQVNNWFTNARRRHRQTTRPLGMRQFRAGSPMPAPLSGFTPLDRWRNSPPEDDHVTPQTIAAAVASSGSNSPWSDLVASPWSPSFPDSWQPSDMSSQGDSASTSQSSVSSFLSHQSASRAFSRQQSRRVKTRAAKVQYECTFCRQSFKKKHDWARHERAVHMPELDTYTCSSPLQMMENMQTWRFGQPEPECSLCGHPSPDQDHLAAHDFESCAERPVSQRTFSRKDHFWQHLSKYHGCRKWEGWELDLNLWRKQHDTFQSYCGFCNATMGSWTARLSHLAEHFKSGLTMENWLDQNVLSTPST